MNQGFVRRARVLLGFALRDLRGGISGFGVFIACIALGVAAIVGVASVSRGLSDGLATEGRRVVGGDVAFALIHRELAPDERAFLEARGNLDTIAGMRAMARREDGDATLVELKAVPANYPTIGEAVLSPAMSLADALGKRDGVDGFVAEATLAARLDLKPGDIVKIGDLVLQYRAELVSEPDKLASGVGFGPRVILSMDAFQRAGLVQPGSLVHWTNRVRLADPASAGVAGEAAVDKLIADAKAAFPQAGWEIRTRSNVSPQFERNLQRFTQFLVLIGLTALIVGGVGVANAARAFVDRKTNDLATLKALGASGGDAFAVAAMEIVAIALLAIGLGEVVGAAAPFAVAAYVGSIAALPFNAAIHPDELARGALYGLLTALAFSIPPLGLAHDAPVSALFRGRVEPQTGWPRRRYLVLLGIVAALLIGAIVLFAGDRRIALLYLGVAGVGFVALRGVAALIMAGARRAPRSRHVEMRLALSNIHRPGAVTTSTVLSLGLGLTLVAALTQIDGNLREELQRTLPGRTPSFFFLDIRSSQTPAFDAFMQAQAPDAKLEEVPMMRGRIVRLKGKRPDEIRASEDAEWALDGDRGVTFATSVPEGSRIVAGDWWPAEYAGPPLVSMEASVARGVGLDIGDEVTLNVLGRDVTAKIANLRQVDWRTLGINFVFVYSPNTFAGAPYTSLATATFPAGGDNTRELDLLRKLSNAFPAITSVRVKEALEALDDVVRELTLAIRAASAVALIASALVIGGAVAAGQRTKLYETVILKTLGATRGNILRMLLIEYGALGFITGVFGVLAGMAAAWIVVARVMRLSGFIPIWSAALAAVAISLALTIGLGLAGAWRVFNEKPARRLRDL